MNLLINSHTDRVCSLTNVTNYPLGVYNGKMGWCLYLFIMSNRYNRENWNVAAIKILYNIFRDIDTISSIDLPEGLIGIGLGINYLIEREYIDGDVNKVLKDVDNVIFKIVSSSKYQINCSEMIDTLYYFAIRLGSQSCKSENYSLFSDIIIFLLNELFNHLDDRCFETPFIYSLDYKLPYFLFVLSKVYCLDICNSKIQKMMNELEDKVLTVIPRLHAHKLYLMWGMVSINKCFQNSDWNKHIKFFQEWIDIKYIIGNELKSGNIFFKNGVSSIYFFIKQLKEYFSIEQLEWNDKLVKEKIVNSKQWKYLETNSSDTFLSLANGFSSAILVLSEISNTKCHENRFK